VGRNVWPAKSTTSQKWRSDERVLGLLLPFRAARPGRCNRGACALPDGAGVGTERRGGDGGVPPRLPHLPSRQQRRLGVHRHCDHHGCGLIPTRGV